LLHSYYISAPLDTQEKNNRKQNKQSSLCDPQKNTLPFSPCLRGKTKYGTISALLFETHTMKQFNFILVLVFASLSSFAMAQTNETSADQDTIGLIPFKGHETVILGQYVDYTGNVHGSVGIQVEVNYLNDGILKFIGSEVTYRSQESPMPPGGDSAYKSFLFQATEVGETTITIQEIFRGEIRQEFTIVITVVAAEEKE
jgi:hypothetical protein